MGVELMLKRASPHLPAFYDYSTAKSAIGMRYKLVKLLIGMLIMP
jgi:hypothetical protein